MTPQSPELERRGTLEIRTDGTRITGHAIVFDSRSADLGGFIEIIRPQAVDRSMGGDVVALYNHDAAQLLGRTPKTLQLRKDDRGLAFSLEPAPTQAGREALELVRRGDLTGASFGFKTVKDVWSTDGGVSIRELLDIELVEISLTAFPAYRQTDVAVAQRALQAYHRAQGSRIDWLRRQHRVRL